MSDDGTGDPTIPEFLRLTDPAIEPGPDGGDDARLDAALTAMGNKQREDERWWQVYKRLVATLADSDEAAGMADAAIAEAKRRGRL